MQTLLQGLDILLPVVYAAITALYTASFVRGEDVYPRATRALLYGVLGVHASYLAMRGFHLGYFPLGGKPEFFSWVAVSVAFVYAMIERNTHNSKTGAFFVVISFVMQTLGTVQMGYSQKHPVLLENPVYALHAFFMVFGVTALAIGTLYALMYVLFSRQLKARELGMFFKRLPPLGALLKMTKTATFLGFVLFGLGLIIGHLVAFSVPELVNHFDTKFIISDSIWIAYGWGIAYVRMRGLPGLKIAYLSITGFTVFLISVGLASHTFLQ